MSTEPSVEGTDERSDANAQRSPKAAVAARLPLQRDRFGVSQKPVHRSQDEDAPFSRSDLKKGRGELMGDHAVHINWRVLATSSAVILAFSLWAILLPNQAQASMKTVVRWISINLGWYSLLSG